MPSSLHPSVKHLLDWCDAHGVLIDSQIEIFYDEDRGMHILSRDAPISANTTLARIPKGTVLSARTCSLSEYIPFELHGLGAQLCLTFALYSEMLKGQPSDWFGYIQSLPTVDLPVFWPSISSFPRTKSEEETDLYDPMTWLRGTEADKLLHVQENNGRTLRENIDLYYHEVVVPTLQKPEILHVLGEEPQLLAYHQAYSLVSSRAFLVDSYHGLAMTPVADVFNHSLENHVHLETDFYVCSTCGSLNECEHDDDDVEDIENHSEKLYRTTKRDADHDLYYEMVCNGDISPHEEVFNTYGETLSNAQLLVQYGFIIDPNDNDTISFDLDEVLHSISQSNIERGVPAIDNAELVLSADLSSTSNLVFSHNANKIRPTELCINSDGQISHQLWILLVKVGQKVIQDGRESSPYDMEKIVKTQLWLEDAIAEGGECDEWRTNDGSAYTHLVLEVARLVVKLCNARKQSIGWPTKPVDNLGYLLDTIPEHLNRTRLALCMALCENSIIDSCKTGWSDIFDALAVVL